MSEGGDHWRDQSEKAAGYWQMRFMLASYRLLGARGLRLVAYPIVFFFWLFAAPVRALSRAFLERAARFRGAPAPRKLETFKHVSSFAFSMIEKIAAWSGDIDLSRVRFHDDSVGDLIARLESGKGAVVICSHLGNVEVLRALATRAETGVTRKFGVTSIVDFGGTAQFNKLLKEINPESMTRLVSAVDMGVDTVLELQSRLAEGELIVIAGDRTASTTRDKTERVSFLGAEAKFPQGAFILASLMESPVYFMFGVRERDMDPESVYDMRVARSKADFSGSRKERREKTREMIGEFARLLEGYAAEHPLQWYNFYDFWK